MPNAANGPSSAPRRDIAVTFAGGGNRSFFALGLLNRWAPTLEPRIAAIAACSAGACVATIHFSRRVEATNQYWRSARAGLIRNVQWSRVLSGHRPTPHGQIYRDTILHAYAEGGLERIRNLPFPVFVLASAMPRWWPAALGTLLGFGAYNLERRLQPDLIHEKLGRRIGFSPHLIDARSCETADELADLVMASSATPPFTRMGRFRGRTLLDGGMIDSVPAAAAEQAAGVRGNLALLTQPYPKALIGRQGSRLYIAPTKPVPIERWDYTRPDLLDETIAMGEREADLHRSALERFLAHPDGSSPRPNRAALAEADELVSVTAPRR